MKAKLVRWTPNPPNKWKLRTIEGLIQDTIKDDSDREGWHILDPSTGYVTRCWSFDGTLEHLRDVVL